MIYGYARVSTDGQLGDRVTHWWVSFGVAFPITVAFAVASWWLIEKPAQRFKPALLRFEDRVLRWSSSKSKVGQAVFQSLIIDLPSSAR